MTLTLIIFIILMMFGFPIAIAMGLGALGTQFLGGNTTVDTIYIIRTMIVGIDSTPILAIPLFILSGTLMAKGGISKKLFDFFAYIVGKRTAGLPCAVVLTCLFYGAISGSGPATAAAVGGMTIPLLVSIGYEKDFISALVAVSGGLGLIIPPSISFINYGLVTGVSVTSLFNAGIIPGIVIGVCIMGYTYIYFKIHGEDKEKIGENYERLKNKGFLIVIKESSWALLCPILILGSIYKGISTPTEAAALSVLYALLTSIYAYKTIKWNEVWPLLIESVKSIAPLCLLIAMATTIGRLLTLANAPQQLSIFIQNLLPGKVAFLIVLNVTLLILGMFIDGAPAILILSPLLLPIAQKYGINPVHLGVIIVTNLTIGLASPPFGLNLFVISSLSNINVLKIGKKAIPIILAFVIALVLITFIPKLSLLLVN